MVVHKLPYHTHVDKKKEFIESYVRTIHFSPELDKEFTVVCEFIM